MFTGIIESSGIIRQILPIGDNVDFWMESGLSSELRIDQSVAHNGVCLTVVEINGDRYRITAVAETLKKTTLGEWRADQKVNLERCLRVGDRLDGHFVQGHVDGIAECVSKEVLSGSWLYTFRFPAEFGSLVVEKGSICIDGVSLTAFAVGRDTFTVTIIPYTYAHTSFNMIEKGSRVNIEFDVLGKYFLRQQTLAEAI